MVQYSMRRSTLEPLFTALRSLKAYDLTTDVKPGIVKCFMEGKCLDFVISNVTGDVLLL